MHNSVTRTPVNQGVLLQCVENGRKIVLPHDQAWSRLWETKFAWLIPPDRYRQCHSGVGWDRLSRRLPPRVRLTFETLLKRGRLATTYDELRIVDETLLDATDGAINRRVKIISDFFGPRERPFEPCDVTANGQMVSAYRPRDTFTWFLVMQVDPATGIPDSDFDWDLLQTQPHAPSLVDGPRRFC